LSSDTTAPGIEPHLWTDDFPRMVAWYREVLDFEVAAWYPDEATATWCRMRRGPAALMIAATPDPGALAPDQQHLAAMPARARGPGGPLSLYLHVEDADAVHAEARAAGADIIEDIWDAWWGGRQFTVVDPDGNWWTVFRSSGD
jgi:uncharacterized glyoxalase superfamily protein PhnB